MSEDQSLSLCVWNCSVEGTPGCWTSRQSCKEKAISPTGQKKEKMGKRTQTLDRGRLERSVMDRQSLRCSDHKEEHSWDAEKMKRCWRSAWRHLSSMVEAMWLSGGALVVVKWEICIGLKGSWIRKAITPFYNTIPCERCLTGANFLPQQDNDPKHSSKLCKNYLGKKQSAGILSIMEWPAQSTDLNPIELL